MSSVVQICNQALLNLGDTTIGALTDVSKAAKLCNYKYEAVRDAVFRSYPWNCLQVRASLALSSTAPTYGYDHKYQLPTNPYCLKVLEVQEDVENGYEWRVEGRYILTDADTCTILYVARVTDPNEYDVLLQEAISARLAAEIAYPLTGNRGMMEDMWKLYQQKIREARSCDAQEGHPSELFTDEWLESRE